MNSAKRLVRTRSPTERSASNLACSEPRTAPLAKGLAKIGFSRIVSPRALNRVNPVLMSGDAGGSNPHRIARKCLYNPHSIKAPPTAAASPSHDKTIYAQPVLPVVATAYGRADGQFPDLMVNQASKISAICYRTLHDGCYRD